MVELVVTVRTCYFSVMSHTGFTDFQTTAESN